MKDETKIRRRVARELNPKSLVIDVTERELELIKLNLIQIERVKTTPQYIVYRRKPK